MVDIRPATADDLEAIVALLADDDLGRGREDARLPLDPGYLAAYDAIAADPNQMLLVADDGGAVVGCLQLTFIPGLTRRGLWRGQIEGVRVARTQRGAGIGRALIERAIAECRARHCGLVQLTTDKTRSRAHAFYASLGFEASHEGMKLAL